MTYLVTLNLNQNERTLAYITNLFAMLSNVTVDGDYGIITISPKNNLYAIRVLTDVDTDELGSIKEIGNVREIYQDSPVSTCA
jgi:hypothetical protein